MAKLLGSVGGVVEDVDHDLLELLVDLVERPAQTHAVLAHLQRGGGYAAGVGSLAGGKEDAALLEDLRRFRGGGHVRALAHGDDAVLDQRLGMLGMQLVLRGAGKSHVAGHVPDGAILVILGLGMLVYILLDALALNFLDALDGGQVHAVLVVDPASGIAHGDHLAAQLRDLFVGVDGHVAGAGDDHALAGEGFALDRFEHLVHQIGQAIAGGLCAGQGAAVGQALAGEHAFIEAGDALVLAVEVADLAAAHADVAGGHVDVLADVTVQLGHEALAEGHDFLVGLALGVKVRTALAAADGQAGEGVFEDLLKAEEFEDAEVHRGMEAQAALVGADGVVELHAVALVDADMALVVHPGHAEEDHAVRLDHALEDGVALVDGIAVHDRREGFEHLARRLMEFRFAGILFDQKLQNFLCVGHEAIPPWICRM